jgi:hypothetical protein
MGWLKAVGGVIETVIRWAWKNPYTAAAVGITWAMLRRIREKRRQRGRTAAWADVVWDIFSPVGDYIAMTLAATGVCAGIYEYTASLGAGTLKKMMDVQRGLGVPLIGF